MKKYKILFICLLIPFLVLSALTFLKFKKTEEFRQKIALSQELRKVLRFLMIDLRQAREKSIRDVPADGNWYDHIVFDNARQGALEYFAKGGQLFRINNGNTLLIANNIAGLRIRRELGSPGILEVQIEAQKNVSLVYNLRVRILHN